MQGRCAQVAGKLAGLGQGGNTCYIASSLQVLFHSEGWLEFYNKRKCGCGRDTCGSCLMAGTFAVAHAAANVADTRVTLALWRPMIAHVGFQPGAQEDPDEFWAVYANRWGEAAATAESDRQLFMKCLGIETEERVWWTPECGCGLNAKKTVAPGERLLWLMLALTEDAASTSVYRLLEYFFASRAVDAKDLGSEDCCPACGTAVSVVHKTCVADCGSLTSFTVFIKRCMLNNRKNRREVHIDPEIRLGWKKFRLVAVNQHLGEKSGGHYIAWVKADGRETWHVYDDGRTFRYVGTPPAFWRRSVVTAAYVVAAASESCLATGTLRGKIVGCLGERGAVAPLRVVNRDAACIELGSKATLAAAAAASLGEMPAGGIGAGEAGDEAQAEGAGEAGNADEAVGDDGEDLEGDLED